MFSLRLYGFLSCHETLLCDIAVSGERKPTSQSPGGRGVVFECQEH